MAPPLPSETIAVDGSLTPDPTSRPFTGQAGSAPLASTCWTKTAPLPLRSSYQDTSAPVEPSVVTAGSYWVPGACATLKGLHAACAERGVERSRSRRAKETRRGRITTSGRAAPGSEARHDGNGSPRPEQRQSGSPWVEGLGARPIQVAAEGPTATVGGATPAPGLRQSLDHHRCT